MTELKQLPIIKIGDKEYYDDKRLREYRNVNNQHDRIAYKTVNHEQLVKQATALGFNPDERIYSLCVEDVICAISDVLDDEGGRELSDDELRALIEHGKKATEWIDWHEILFCAIQDKLYDLFEYKGGGSWQLLNALRPRRGSEAKKGE